MKKNSMVFDYGDFGKEFFVILHGQVEIQIPITFNITL